MMQQPPPHALAKTELAYAPYWRRAVAYVIDWVLLWAVWLLIAIGVFSVAPNDLQTIANIGPVFGAIAWAYFALLESSPARGTLGKVAFDLIVADVHGDPIGFWRASARYYLKILCWLTLGVGWLMPAFTPRKQGLHDLIAGTLVLRRVRYFVIGPDALTEPGEHWDGRRWVASIPPVANMEQR